MATEPLDLEEILEGTPPDGFAYTADQVSAGPSALFIGHITADEALQRWVALPDQRPKQLDTVKLHHGYALFDRHDEQCTEEPDDQGHLDCDCPHQLRHYGEQWFVLFTTSPRAAHPVTRVTYRTDEPSVSVSHVG